MKKPISLIALLIAFTSLCSSAAFKRTEDVIYGRKFGTALTLDVFEPEKPNGFGVIFMVSGGVFSDHAAINEKTYEPLLTRGYTVFAVVHGSQPRFIIPEIEEDIHRAVRFIRHNAAKWKVSPDHFGITGGSAVQAVACFFPPTDFLNWGSAGDDAVGYGTTKQFSPAFGPRNATAEGRQELGKEISPINYVTSNMAPTLIIHGSADRLVPLYQAQIFEKRCREANAPFKLIVREGKDHGWPEMGEDTKIFADWFDKYLRGLKKPD